MLLSVCRYANAKGQRSSGQKRRFPSSPQINQNLCGIARKTTVKLFDQSPHHLNQNYQVLLHQNQAPSCSLPSLPPQSSTYTSRHVHIWFIDWTPFRQATSKHHEEDETPGLPYAFASFNTTTLERNPNLDVQNVSRLWLEVSSFTWRPTG